MKRAILLTALYLSPLALGVGPLIQLEHLHFGGSYKTFAVPPPGQAPKGIPLAGLSGITCLTQSEITQYNHVSAEIVCQKDGVFFRASVTCGADIGRSDQATLHVFAGKEANHSLKIRCSLP